MSNNRYKSQPTVLETILVGLFKALWFLITLPFKGLKRGKKGLSLEERNYITEKRLKIEGMLKSDNDIELKHAVMEADKLVDYTFQQKNYPGMTFADRLRAAEQSMPRNIYNDLWNGHKIRNQLAHENELRITNQELRDAAKKLLNYLKQI